MGMIRLNYRIKERRNKMQTIYKSKADQVISDVCGLSSGTLATITRKSLYSEIDEIHSRFIQFTIAALSSSPNEFGSWQEAWERYSIES
jgi:hypothetical protein